MVIRVFSKRGHTFCIQSAVQKYADLFSPLPILTDSYRILPILTDSYGFLPLFTASYRFLPIEGSFAVRRTANERQTVG